MPTKEEISAYLSALQIDLDAKVASQAQVSQAAAKADELDAAATAIEAAGSVTVGHAGTRATVSGASVVSTVVTWLRGRATAIRDALALPDIPAPPG